MEYVEGTNLNAYIKQLGRIPLAEAVSIVNDVGNALSFMHAHKMLHLDLKPLNIMRRTNGEIILIDFGLSKQYDQSGMPETSTTVGAGTPGYAPLEQANYHDGRGFPVTMDVYALTASFYKMLTGLTPQDATEVLNEGLDVDSLRRANVGEQVISVIERGMNPIVKNRSQSIDELLKMVHSLASSDGNIMNNSEETVFDY
jgi:serine/threonine protein kinase